MNKCFLMGTAGRDAELNGSTTGTSWTKFSIAVDKGWGEKKKTNWFTLIAYSKVAERVAKNVRKGHRYLFMCEADKNVWTDRNGGKHDDSVFIIEDFWFADSKTSTERQVEGQTPDGYISLDEEVGDEVPFN